MRKFVTGSAMLIIVSFLLAIVQSCTQNNGILKPSCQIFEVDLDDKWWYPQNNPAEPAIYFRANGLLVIEGQTDSLSFALENCNKIRVTHLASYNQELWVIKYISRERLSIHYPAKGLVTYLRTR